MNSKFIILNVFFYFLTAFNIHRLICILFKKVATPKISQIQNYEITVFDNEGNNHQIFEYNITGKDFALPWILSSLNKDVRSFRSQRKSKNFRTSVQAFTVDDYFFPAPGLFNFTCNIQKNLEEVYNCSIKKFNLETEKNFPYRKFTFTFIAPIFNKNNTDEISGFTHGSSMHGVSNNRPNKMNTNCYQEVIFMVFTHPENHNFFF